MATILCIETSTDICSVCIARDGEILAIEETTKSFSHSEVIAVFIQQILKYSGVHEKELDAVAISGGPGSYTALRIGASTAKGLCFGLDIPLIAIDTMKALAKRVVKEVNPNEVILPLLDARRMEVYVSAFNDHLENIKSVEPIIVDENSFLDYQHNNKVHFLGDGSDKIKDVIQLQNAVFHPVYSSSKGMVELAEEKFREKLFEDISYYEPMYYKSPNITVQKKNILR